MALAFDGIFISDDGLQYMDAAGFLEFVTRNVKCERQSSVSFMELACEDLPQLYAKARLHRGRAPAAVLSGTSKPLLVRSS